jgi:WD40 repeat protein
MKFEKEHSFLGHSSGVYALDYDGFFVYSGSSDCYVTRWDLTINAQDKFAVKFDFPVYALKLVNNNQHLIVGLASGDIHIFDLTARIELKFFQQHKEAVFCIQYNVHLNQFYAADAIGNVSVWDAKTFGLLGYFPLDCGKIRRIAVDSTGEKLAIACQDGTIRIIDSITFNELNRLIAHENGVGAVIFSPENPSILYSGGKDAMLKKWDLRFNQVELEIPAHNYMIYDLQFIGEYLLSSSRDKTIKCWNANDLSILQRLDFKSKGHKHSVNALVTLSTDSFVSCSDDRQVISWKVKE